MCLDLRMFLYFYWKTIHPEKENNFSQCKGSVKYDGEFRKREKDFHMQILHWFHANSLCWLTENCLVWIQCELCFMHRYTVDNRQLKCFDHKSLWTQVKQQHLHFPKRKRKEENFVSAHQTQLQTIQWTCIMFRTKQKLLEIRHSTKIWL